LVIFCIETAFYNELLKERYKGGGIEVTGRQGRRRMKLLDDLKERREYSHLKEEALDRTMWRARFGRGFEPVVRGLIIKNEMYTVLLPPGGNPIAVKYIILFPNKILLLIFLSTLCGPQNIPSPNLILYLTLRLLMSYIYGAPILDVSRSHTTQHSQ
jgi:hypothetical protein